MLFSCLLDNLQKRSVHLCLFLLKYCSVAIGSMEYYMQKTYYKTASLISNSCKAIALLAGQSAEVSNLAYEYGKNLVCTFFLLSFLILRYVMYFWNCIFAKRIYNIIFLSVIPCYVCFRDGLSQVLNSMFRFPFLYCELFVCICLCFMDLLVFLPSFRLFSC